MSATPLGRQINRQIRKAYLAAAAALVAEQVSLDQLDRAGLNAELPIFTVSQVATVADIHPQTLRQYDRMNLIVPSRTAGGARRYSLRDVDRLAQAQRMAQEENINLAGIARILALSEENRQLRRQIERLKRTGESIFAAAADGEVVEIRRTRRQKEWQDSIARPLLLTASVEELTRDAGDPNSFTVADDDAFDDFDDEAEDDEVEDGAIIDATVEDDAGAEDADADDAGAEDGTEKHSEKQ